MANKKYQYGGRYKPEGGVTPIDERKDIQAAEDMRQASVANMHKYVTGPVEGLTLGWSSRPSGVSARNRTGVLGSYTGAGGGTAVVKGLQSIGDDIARGVVGAAKHFPGYHSSVGGLKRAHSSVSSELWRDWGRAVGKRGSIAESTKAIYNLRSHLGYDAERLVNPTHPTFAGDDKAKREVMESTAAKFGKEAVEGGIKRGVGRALGYATGIGLAVDIGLAAKWAYDYNRDNPGAVAAHKEALYRKNLKAGSPGKWGVDI